MQRNITWAAVAVAAAVLLTACGGGGGGSTASPQAPGVSGGTTTPPQTPVANSDVFIEVRNMPTVSSAFNRMTALHAIPIDLNGDGREDLVFASWANRNGSGFTGNAQCANTLTALINQQDGTFKDETSKFIPGVADIGGCARKSEAVDINGDGKLDIVFAVNQEDGRLTANPNDLNGPLAALISKGNIFEIKKFDSPSWFHSVGVGYDSLGRAFVAGKGYTNNTNNPQTSFRFDALNNPIDSGIVLPQLSANTFRFYNINGTKSESTILLQTLITNTADTAYTSIGGHAKNSNGTWDRLPDLALAPIVGRVDTVSFTNESTGLQPVFSLNGNAFTFATLHESCTMKTDPKGPQIAVFKLGGRFVPNFVDGMKVRENDLKLFSVLVGVTVLNGAVTLVPLNIKNEVRDNINSNFFDCKDVTGDGFADIIVYPYNANGMPYIYANNRMGGFEYMGSKMFPVISESWGEAVSSKLSDFDGDGKVDLLVWPANGILGSSFTPRYFKGQAALKFD